MLKTAAKNVLRPVWTPLRRRIEFVVRNEIAKKAAEPHIRSMVCRQKDFAAPWYQHWTREIAAGAPALPADQEAVWGTVWKGMRGKWMHRKLWEWCVIAQALEERGMLRSDRRGIGFAVGKEPLSSLFAARGVQVLASDFQGEDAQETWGNTGQLGESAQAIHWPGIVPEAEFNARVRYQNIDMRDLSAVPKGAFDFSWSSCSFEHLGNLEAGLQFLAESLDCLKPGGVAVHTTEYNVSSNESTVEEGTDVIYRRKDIEAFDTRLRGLGCAIESLDFDAGHEQHDMAYDIPPFHTQGRQHVKLKLHGYVSTSLVLIIRKPL